MLSQCCRKTTSATAAILFDVCRTSNEKTTPKSTQKDSSKYYTRSEIIHSLSRYPNIIMSDLRHIANATNHMPSQRPINVHYGTAEENVKAIAFSRATHISKGVYRIVLNSRRSPGYYLNVHAASSITTAERISLTGFKKPFVHRLPSPHNCIW